ncbi:hypothetical protein [Halocynthiibacter namhaensis]|uniref:hypothetical protein n=1 Tax=Halocynthiibacter namhaensis TaxID=1290553 RepID=UPI0012E0BD52|nr:hypothetical protein [Halocynthiibacter namhaensis]
MMRFTINVFVVCAFIWGPSLYFGISATRQAHKISNGEFCWFVRNPEAKASGFLVDWIDMELTLETGSPYHFWQFPSDKGLGGTRPYFGIVIPSAEFGHEYFAWSFKQDDFWHMEYWWEQTLGMSGFINECQEMLNDMTKGPKI